MNDPDRREVVLAHENFHKAGIHNEYKTRVHTANFYRELMEKTEGEEKAAYFKRFEIANSMVVDYAIGLMVEMMKDQRIPVNNVGSVPVIDIPKVSAQQEAMCYPRADGSRHYEIFRTFLN